MRVVKILIPRTPNASLIEEALGLINPVRFASGGVLIKGGPAWAIALVAHEFGHPARWVAVWDPAAKGFRVIMRHHPEAPKIGEVIKDSDNLPTIYL